MFKHNTNNVNTGGAKTTGPAKLAAAFKRLFKKPQPTPKIVAVEDFEPLHKIGQGSSNSVFLVKDKDHGRLYALKQVPKSAANCDEEQRILRTISQHPDAPRTLLSLVASFSDSDNSYLLTEWCGGKDLTSLLAAGHRLSPEHAKSYAAQLVSALETLHRLGIVHRDVKPSNVFLTKEGNAVLGDLGRAMSTFTDLAMHGGDQEPDYISFDVNPDATSGGFFKPTEEALTGESKERVGTQFWMSPAQHAGLPYSYDADIWSLGLLLFRLTTGRLPFGANATNAAEAQAAYASDPIDFRAADGLDHDIKDLLQRMLEKDGDDRPHILQVKAHPYFHDVDWDAVARHEAPVPWVPAEPYVPTTARPKLLTPGVPCPSDRGHARNFYFASEALLTPPPGPLRSLLQRIVKWFRKPLATQHDNGKGKLSGSSLIKTKIKKRNGTSASARESFRSFLGFFKSPNRCAAQDMNEKQGGVLQGACKDEDAFSVKVDLGAGQGLSHEKHPRSSGPSLSARISDSFRRRWYTRVKTVNVGLRDLDLTC